MPIKVDNIMCTHVRASKSGMLFKKGNTLRENVSAKDRNILNDTHFNSLQTLVIKILNKMNPILNKHPKVSNKIMTLSEKFFRESESLK